MPDSPPLRPGQRTAAARLLAATSPAAAELGRLFARHGHQLALVGGSVRDAFRGKPPGDLDLATDARPERVLELTKGWADSTWAAGMAFGTVGLRKGSVVVEITTYRSEHYVPESRKPAVSPSTRSGTASVVRSRSSERLPRNTSRTEPPTRASS